MLVVGPPRSGKTSCLMVPGVLDAPAAVVSTSTKGDVLEATVFRRYALGNCFVFDPTGSTPLPPGAYPLRWSPVVGCDTFESSVSMAHALGSAARPGSALGESAHWVERAEGLLAPLLFAANWANRDMASVCRWVLGRDLREPLAALEDSGHEMAQVVLAGVLATEDRERSGIFSTTAGLLGVYRSEAALATTVDPNFDPGAFARSSDSLYVCAPAHAQERLAPIVVALLEQIRSAVYARPQGAAPVVFALDEVASIAPLPSLPALAAEGGGQGLITVACLQDLSQARARWGEVAEGFFSLFNTKVVLPGIGDYDTLKLISALAGDVHVPTRSVNVPQRGWSTLISGQSHPASVTHSSEWRPRLPVDAVARGTPGHALCLQGSELFTTRMVPWWEHPAWSGVARSNGRYFSQVIRSDLEMDEPRN
jgi:type IV secretory pathway TraG/TraD family ATPase VirD4